MTGNRPLCPHCFRTACPWLMAYHMAITDHANGINASLPEPDRCPHAGGPLPAGAKIFLRERLAE